MNTGHGTNMCPQVPANVYVKKTALGQQTIDISGLEAPQDVPATDSDKNSTISNHSSDSSQDCSSQGRTGEETEVNGNKDSSVDSNQASGKLKSDSEQVPVSVEGGEMNGNNQIIKNGKLEVEKNGKLEAHNESTVNNLAIELGVL